MRLSVCVLILGVLGWAQSTTEAEKAAIQRAQSLTVASLDKRLPKVSLKFFLEYEADGAPVTWDICDCVEKTSNPANECGDASTCVEANFDLNDRISVSVVVSVESSGAGSSTAPKLVRATVREMGAVHTVRRLGDLPMEMHRQKPRLPQEPPMPVASLQISPNEGWKRWG